ncbi:hypothetical protein AV530_004873 [Patagioenas fasciata monilis]|uniref:Uncharacterized protein n=1 Tax=Patagioenas fasciata monilis TaxID=372326 RepID=A0A1V4JTN0_PATFA|nr:hypothetical protein AV530_004873 [Patagioenas fasciata monilis]
MAASTKQLIYKELKSAVGVNFDIQSERQFDVPLLFHSNYKFAANTVVVQEGFSVHAWPYLGREMQRASTFFGNLLLEIKTDLLTGGSSES